MAVRTINFYGAYSTFRPFILTVDSGADSQFTIPTTGGGYNYSVNTSDGQFFNGVTGNLLIVFPSANTLYDIEIRGLFPYLANTSTEKEKLLETIQWGDIVWKSMFQSYFQCTNWKSTAVDIPNLSECTSLDSFSRDNNFNSSLIGWDFSNLNDISGFAFNSISFNQEVSHLNVSAVTNMDRCFQQATMFDKDIDWSDPVTGSISVTNISNFALNCKSKSIKLQCGNVNYIEYTTWRAPNLIELILIDMPVSFYISENHTLTGTAIDNLANSVKDMTGFASPSITMTLAQRASCNQALWTNKNWTIIAI